MASHFIFVYTILILFLISIQARNSKFSSTSGFSQRSRDKGKANPIKKSNKSFRDEFRSNNDDFDDDEKTQPYKRERVVKSRDKFSKNKQMEIIPWNDKRFEESKGPSWKERIEDIAKQSQSVYKDVFRRAKMMRSSSFEGMLLKATWPDNEPIPVQLLDEIIKYSIPAFKFGRTSAEDDPYHMTVHKLWTKMCEKDWRTTVKALYILHSISRDSSPETCGRFALTIRDMARERNPKRPDHRYFDTRLVSDVDVLGEKYSDFIVAYATYVFYRTRSFSNRFDELKTISESTAQKLVVARLRKAQQLINYGLECVVSKKTRHPISSKASQLVAHDLRELWKLFSVKLAPLLNEGERVVGEEGEDGDDATTTTTTSYGGAKANKKDILALLQFYETAGDKIKEYFQKVIKVCEPYRYKVPVDLDSSSSSTVNKDKLQECILRLSGGAREGLLTMGIGEREELAGVCNEEMEGGVAGRMRTLPTLAKMESSGRWLMRLQKKEKEELHMIFDVKYSYEEDEEEEEEEERRKKVEAEEEDDDEEASEEDEEEGDEDEDEDNGNQSEQEEEESEEEDEEKEEVEEEEEVEGEREEEEEEEEEDENDEEETADIRNSNGKNSNDNIEEEEEEEEEESGKVILSRPIATTGRSKGYPMSNNGNRQKQHNRVEDDEDDVDEEEEEEEDQLVDETEQDESEVEEEEEEREEDDQEQEEEEEEEEESDSNRNDADDEDDYDS